MTGKCRQTVALAVAVVGTAMFAIPSLAQTRFSQLDTMLKKQASGISVPSTVDGPAQPSQAQRQWDAANDDSTPVADPQKVAANIDKRLSQLKALISVALDRRVLTASQVVGLNGQLDLIQTDETKDKRMGFTDANTSYLLSRIDKVKSVLNSELGENQARQVVARPSVSPLSNLENERLYLSARITQGIRLGRLSDKQAKAFRAELDQVGARERQPGGLTPRDQDDVRRALVGIEARISTIM